jgi:hypothetical protein
MYSANRSMFKWQRFWVPRTGTIDLSDGGFLIDPTNPLWAGRMDAKQLPELASYRALVLLGEPGIGKSTALRKRASILKLQQHLKAM